MSGRVLGDHHETTAFRSRILADILREAGHYEQALPVYEQVTDSYGSSMGAEHPLVGAAMAGKAQTLVALGDYSAANAAFEVAFGLLEAAGWQTGSTYYAARVGYGELLARMGQAHEAEQILRPALQALEGGSSAPHRGPAQAGRAALARCLAAQGRIAEAALLFEQVHRIYREHYGPEHPRTRKALSELTEVRAGA